MGVIDRMPTGISLPDREWQSPENQQETQTDPMGLVNQDGPLNSALPFMRAYKCAYGLI